ncbi:MAG: metalloregulator ArsR/SmtB family transcription factor [Candidatus Pacebacteria bacterium]|nr:metalloregulator ArsR/SmtB family transcription factor [Candidatus Paceibacterota bacterium]
MRELTDVLTAIAHPTRRAIISRLAASGPMRFTDIAEPLAMHLNAVTKHLKTLERARLVKRNRAGREVFVSLQPARLRLVSEYVHEYEHFWNQRLNEFEKQFKNKKLNKHT